VVIKIKRESGFLMKSKEQIEEVLKSERVSLEDIDNSMTEMQWANNQGWIEALEFVLDDQDKRLEQEAYIKRIQDIGLTDIERNDIIARSIKKLQHENQSLVNDEDSESCGVCTCGVNCP
tara:strand:+ start:2530 stop:2889 length:360 start_codon:yes stop_codon:yes gene_type:complete